MKKALLIALAFSVLTTSAAVTVQARGHDDRPHQETRWERDSDHERDMPFRWHERRDHFTHDNHRMERIHDNRFNNRFPGLRAYRWHDAHGRWFRHNGHIVRDAVLFYNDSDELVSFGYMNNGVFIMIRDDDSINEDHDSFFVSWWRH